MGSYQQWLDGEEKDLVTLSSWGEHGQIPQFWLGVVGSELEKRSSFLSKTRSTFLLVSLRYCKPSRSHLELFLSSDHIYHAQIESKKQQNFVFKSRPRKIKKCASAPLTVAQNYPGVVDASQLFREFSLGKDAPDHRAATVQGIFSFLELNPWSPLPCAYPQIICEHTSLLWECLSGRSCPRATDELVCRN